MLSLRTSDNKLSISQAEDFYLFLILMPLGLSVGDRHMKRISVLSLVLRFHSPRMQYCEKAPG